MAEDAPKLDAENRDDDETPPIAVPTRAPLPPPPDIQFTRPTIRSASGNPSGTGGGASGGPQDISSHGAGIAAGMTFLVSIIAGATLGSWIDGRWNHTGMPWGILLMTIVGAAVGFLNMQRLLTRADRVRREQDKK